MKRFAALCRVSSVAQAKEGTSLDVQRDELTLWAGRNGGEIVHLVEIAETASKRAERTQFRALIDYCRANARRLDGLLVYKLDRASRNLPDYVELMGMEAEVGVPLIVTTAPALPNAAGRLQRGISAVVAAYYTDQLSQDVTEGLRRRVMQEGWFCGRPPLGYCNARDGSKAVVAVEPREAAAVRRIFALAAEGWTHALIARRLAAEGHVSRGGGEIYKSVVGRVLTNRAYIGEVWYKGAWHKGGHEPLVSLSQWTRVHGADGLGEGGGVGYGGKLGYGRAHQMDFGNERVACSCGRPVVGERKIKACDGSRGGRLGGVFDYYRCVAYSRPGHPGGKLRVSGRELDRQMRAALAGLRFDDAEEAELWREALRQKAASLQADTRGQREELTRILRLVAGQKERLLNAHLSGAVDLEQYAAKEAKLRDQESGVREQLAELEAARDTDVDGIVGLFELSQTLENKWVAGDYAVRRLIMDVCCLNLVLNGKNLEIRWRKSFEVLAQKAENGESRGTRI